MKRLLAAAVTACALAILPGCARRAHSVPQGSVVVWEAQADASRVVLVSGAARRVLSEGLAQAGEPAVSPDGGRVLFSARRDAASRPQLFEADLEGGAPRPLAAVDGGAKSPAILPDGSAVFVAPAEGAATPSLFTLAPGADTPKRLTFGAAPATDPYVLADGRVLFVSPQPGGGGDGREALFAVNDDGTGVTAYACNHGGAPLVSRPREEGSRVLFTAKDAPGAPARLEQVAEARPWISRAAVEAAEAPAPLASAAPGWRLVEALPLAPHRVAKRRLSTVDPSKTTGVLLCLDADRTDAAAGHAARVRVTARTASGDVALGDVVPAADGSFVAEVPADVPLGLEALDEGGRVIRSLAPSIWVRPGETRGCIGCHEPHGLAPRNRRPLAVKSAAAKLALPGGGA